MTREDQFFRYGPDSCVHCLDLHNNWDVWCNYNAKENITYHCVPGCEFYMKGMQLDQSFNNRHSEGCHIRTKLSEVMK